MERTPAWDDGMVGKQAAERCRLDRGVPCRQPAPRNRCCRPPADLLATVDLRPCLPTVSAAAEYALWQRTLRSARAKIVPGTAATGINRLIQALETS
jgi:hypothetical protein